jgi:hypothetical protein
VVFLLGLLASSTVTVQAQRNLDVCRVTTSSWSIEEKRGTGIYEVGKFPVDDFEDGARKTFRYESDGNAFSIEAEVEYGDFPAVEKGNPTMINLSLLVDDASLPGKESGFAAVQAGTTYRHKWGTVFVRKDVVKGDSVYTFKLTCSDGLFKSGVQRGDPKWMLKEREH